MSQSSNANALLLHAAWRDVIITAHAPSNVSVQIQVPGIDGKAHSQTNSAHVRSVSANALLPAASVI